MFKRLMNYEEELTNERLKDLSREYGVRVFVKIRLADILPIEGSGISDEAYEFALKSHFDFVIVNADSEPLFGVEYNGPQHAASQQRDRDALKMKLCEQFQFPSLRINFQYLLPRRAGLDLLGWFIHTWFMEQGIAEAYETGQIPPGEYISPIDVLSLPGSPARFPLHLASDALVDFQRRAQSKREQDPVPSCMVGQDPDGTYRALAWLRLNSHYGLRVHTGMRAQLFRIPVVEAIMDLAVLALQEALIRFEAGKALAVSMEALMEELKGFKGKYGVVDGFGYGSQGVF